MQCVDILDDLLFMLKTGQTIPDGMLGTEKNELRSIAQQCETFHTAVLYFK